MLDATPVDARGRRRRREGGEDKINGVERMNNK
jgi:hypothetical protein